jgi:hypothetical protein
MVVVTGVSVAGSDTEVPKGISAGSETPKKPSIVVGAAEDKVLANAVLTEIGRKHAGDFRYRKSGAVTRLTVTLAYSGGPVVHHPGWSPSDPRMGAPAHGPSLDLPVRATFETADGKFRETLDGSLRVSGPADAISKRITPPYRADMSVQRDAAELTGNLNLSEYELPSAALNRVSIYVSFSASEGSASVSVIRGGLLGSATHLTPADDK